jgi:hypothetical protein
MNLYHFTHAAYLPSILNTGLNQGDIPLNSHEGVMGISLTEDPIASPRFQSWSLGVPGKLQYRLSIELQPSDRLMRWRYVPDIIKMDRAYWKKLKGDPYKWWVYFGIITPDKIVEIFDTRNKRAINAEEIKALMSGEVKQGEYASVIKWISFEDALLKKTAQVENPLHCTCSVEELPKGINAAISAGLQKESLPIPATKVQSNKGIR